jgi:hypothetical protein
VAHVSGFKDASKSRIGNVGFFTQQLGRKLNRGNVAIDDPKQTSEVTHNSPMVKWNNPKRAWVQNVGFNLKPREHFTELISLQNVSILEIWLLLFDEF